MTKFALRAAALFWFPMSPISAAVYVDGSSPELAIYSMKPHLDMNPAIPSGIYWFDELQGLGSPFQAYANNSIDGGAYVLGLVSLDASPASAFTISANTGSVGAPFTSSHTRDIAYLGIDQTADILYEVHNSSGTTIFLGSYHGTFDGATSGFSNVYVDSLNLRNQINSSFDFHRPDRNFDVAVYVRESSSPPIREVVPEPSIALLGGLGLLGLLRRRR